MEALETIVKEFGSLGSVGNFLGEAIEDFSAGKALGHSLEFGELIAEQLVRGGEGVETAVAQIIERVSQLESILPEQFADLTRAVGESLEWLKDAIGEGLEWLEQHKEQIVAACELLVFAAVAIADPAAVGTYLMNDPSEVHRLMRRAEKVIS